MPQACPGGCRDAVRMDRHRSRRVPLPPVTSVVVCAKGNLTGDGKFFFGLCTPDYVLSNARPIDAMALRKSARGAHAFTATTPWPRRASRRLHRLRVEGPPYVRCRHQRGSITQPSGASGKPRYLGAVERDKGGLGYLRVEGDLPRGLLPIHLERIHPSKCTKEG